MECCGNRHTDTFHGAAELPFHSNWELPTTEWIGLRPQDRVRVQSEQGANETGILDMIAEDASIFWVWLDQGRGRIAVHRDDAVKVWFEERKLAVQAGMA